MPDLFPPPRAALFRGPFSALLVAVAVVGAGCGEQVTIARYAVPKEAEIAASVELDTPPASNPRAWFFKLDGPQETVGAVEAQFTALVESVRFEDGKPRWTLPDGWSETGGSQMRYATLHVESTDPPLEVSVIPLPVLGNDPVEYLRQNIDRWRGQIGLKPVAGADWLETAQTAGEVRQSSAGDVPVTFVDLRGKTESFDPARMLGAVIVPDLPAVKESNSPAPPTARQPSSPASSLTFKTPEGWEMGKTSPLRAASFAVTNGDKQVDVSAMTAGGDELGNVNRWRGQVGLEPISVDDLDAAARAVEVDGTTARMFDIVGETETILAVIVPTGGQTWFFKLMGDPALAEREKANFEGWVKSVKFP